MAKGSDSAPPLPWVLHPALGTPAQEGQRLVGVGPEEGQKMIRGMQQPSHENCLRELDLFSLEKTRLQQDFIKAFHYLKGSNKKDGDKAV